MNEITMNVLTALEYVIHSIIVIVSIFAVIGLGLLGVVGVCGLWAGRKKR